MLPEERINNNPADSEGAEKIEVDLNATVEVEDSTADVNVAAPIPPRGIAPFTWKAGKDEHPYAGTTKSEPHRGYVGTSLQGKLNDSGGEFDGVVVFVNHINSLAMQRKPTSDLHHFLNTVGAPAPNRTTIGELLQHTKDVLEQEPLGMAEIDWRAQYKKEDGTYHEFIKTMTGFPKHYVDSEGNTTTKALGGKWDNTYEQEVPSPVDGEPVRAQLYVRKFLTESEAKKLMSTN